MIEIFKKVFSNRTVIVVALILTAVVSILVVSKMVSAPEYNAATIASLDDKKMTVMKLAATVVASSTALSMIPGDVATPIANQIAGLTPYFIVILGAILLERILVAIVGYIVFSFIIPAACLLGILYVYVGHVSLRNFAVKLFIFGMALFFVIPSSVKVSDLIYESYQVSIEQTFETANQNNADIEETKKDLSTKDRNWMENVGDYLSNVTSKIGNELAAIAKKGEATLTGFLDAIAVLIITSCVIPILVILIFAWMIKILFGFDSYKSLSNLRKIE